jgi:hypothetical protein
MISVFSFCFIQIGQIRLSNRVAAEMSAFSAAKRGKQGKQDEQGKRWLDHDPSSDEDDCFSLLSPRRITAASTPVSGKHCSPAQCIPPPPPPPALLPAQCTTIAATQHSPIVGMSVASMLGLATDVTADSTLFEHLGHWLPHMQELERQKFQAEQDKKDDTLASMVQERLVRNEEIARLHAQIQHLEQQNKALLSRLQTLAPESPELALTSPARKRKRNNSASLQGSTAGGSGSQRKNSKTVVSRSSMEIYDAFTRMQPALGVSEWAFIDEGTATQFWEELIKKRVYAQTDTTQALKSARRLLNSLAYYDEKQEKQQEEKEEFAWTRDTKWSWNCTRALINPYWLTRMVLDRPSKKAAKQIGECFDAAMLQVSIAAEYSQWFPELSLLNIDVHIQNSYLLHAEEVKFEERKRKELIELAKLLRSFCKEGKIVNLKSIILNDPGGRIKQGATRQF